MITVNKLQMIMNDKYGRVIGHTMAEDDDNHALFYTHDGNKNVSEVVHYSRANGVAAHYEYAPFGEVTAQVRQGGITAYDFAALNPWRFSSEYADDASATVYYNYRHYEPVMGRWLSRDSIGEQGGLLIYGFCRNAFGYDYCGMNWTDWAKYLLPKQAYLLLSAKDCLVTMYNWTINIKQHAGEAYSDKFLHCYASCEFSQDCGTKVSAALGVLKEVGDIIGHSFGLVRDLLFEDRTTAGEDFEYYWQWIVDGGTDLLADGFGVACNWAGKDCRCCCRNKYNEFAQ